MLFDWNALVAGLSLSFYSILAISCIVCYFDPRLRPSKVDASGLNDYTSEIVSRHERNKEIKRSFFLCLAVSSMLDVPVYVRCISLGFPTYCFWSDSLYTTFYIFHLLALCGYAISLGIPLFLWIDMMIRETGQSKSVTAQRIKTYLCVSISLYVVLQLGLIIYRLLKFPCIESFSDCLEALFATLIAAGWWICGNRLRNRVRQLCFREDEERQLLFIINTIMAIITLSYLVRAVFVLILFFHATSQSYVNYLVWTAGTRYFPHIFCSFLLVFLMRRTANTEKTLDVTDILLDDEKQSSIDSLDSRYSAYSFTSSRQSSTAASSRTPSTPTSAALFAARHGHVHGHSHSQGCSTSTSGNYYSNNISASDAAAVDAKKSHILPSLFVIHEKLMSETNVNNNSMNSSNRDNNNTDDSNITDICTDSPESDPLVSPNH